MTSISSVVLKVTNIAGNLVDTRNLSYQLRNSGYSMEVIPVDQRDAQIEALTAELNALKLRISAYENVRPPTATPSSAAYSAASANNFVASPRAAGAFPVKDLPTSRFESVPAKKEHPHLKHQGFTDDVDKSAYEVQETKPNPSLNSTDTLGQMPIVQDDRRVAFHPHLVATDTLNQEADAGHVFVTAAHIPTQHALGGFNDVLGQEEQVPLPSPSGMKKSLHLQSTYTTEEQAPPVSPTRLDGSPTKGSSAQHLKFTDPMGVVTEDPWQQTRSRVNSVGGTLGLDDPTGRLRSPRVTQPPGGKTSLTFG